MMYSYGNHFGKKTVSLVGHSYTFWTMPIMIFSPVSNFGDQSLFTVNERVNSYCNHATLWSFSKYIYLSLCPFLSSCFDAAYTHAHLWFPPLFLAVNHHNNKNWVQFILTHNFWLIFMGMKQKKNPKWAWVYSPKYASRQVCR